MTPSGRRRFEYDVFFSYDTKDERRVRAIREEFTHAGLRSFFAADDLKAEVGSTTWVDTILLALPQSCHLVIFVSTNALTSKWVRREVKAFKADAELRAPGSAERRILLLTEDGADPADLAKRLENDEDLKDLLRPGSIQEALHLVTQLQFATLRQDLIDARAELDQERDLARRSFEFYQHRRFWQPFSSGRKELHIFTCGRDVHDGTIARGGRTNIDKWDYQAAIDITHHFARQHHDSGVEIEQPGSKAVVNEKTRAFDTTGFSSKIADKNCVIIGSPDVSDFAEVALASLLRVQPYTPQQSLRRVGLRIRKTINNYSTFYEPAADDGSGEGIHILHDGVESTFECSESTSYGLMVLADNPFCRPGGTEKILILAGHTGVSTRAMSLLLTESEPWCLDEFYRLDQAVAVMRGPVAAVIKVDYARRRTDALVGDFREIPRTKGSITFETVFELRPEG